MDWFASPLFNGLLSSAIVCLTVFLINEWFHPLPLFKLQMLERSNFSYGLMALAVVLVLALAGSALPSNFFGKVEGFRTAQFAPLALTIGLPQLIITPLVAALLSLRWVDCRWLIAFGIALMIFASLMGMQITSDWARQNFWAMQALQAIGLPSIILPLLMSATSVVAPPEGHYASAMFNTVRGFSSIAAGVLVEWFINHREQFHSNVLVNNVANRPWLISTPVSEQASSNFPLLHDGSISNTENIAGFITLLKHQAIVLSLGDSYLLMAGFAVLLLLLTVWLPKRVWPPQIRF
jgi:DHA2 family multidrug resistance protein